MSNPHLQDHSRESIESILLALADDELILGHRDSEWTGFGPILEEDIAFSNIAQDEIGHALVWYSLYSELTGKDPDSMVFARKWNEFTCCHFVEYPKGDFGYTVARQYMFDAAERIKLEDLTKSSFIPLAEGAARILREESYHLLHSQSLLERLGDATPESSQKMQSAFDEAFPQAIGMFEPLEYEDKLVRDHIFSGNSTLMAKWLEMVVPIVSGVSLNLAVGKHNGSYSISCKSDDGGRRQKHTHHLKELVDDLQKVYQMAPGAKW